MCALNRRLIPDNGSQVQINLHRLRARYRLLSIGAKEFQCMGARPPHDHPHVYLDMGADNQILCPYCSTLFVYDPQLRADETEPKGCLVISEPAAG